MTESIKIAFEKKTRRLPISSLLPLRSIPDGTRKSQKYRRIEASIHEMGVVEPLVVHPHGTGRGRAARYLLLDGHLRHDVLKEQGEKDVLCLISTDDEAFTYNHKVNQISPIQEHFMILRALENGVSEERIAKVLSIDISAIRKKRDLLDGVCKEAVALLKDRCAGPGAIREIKRVVPMRQIEISELMSASNNFTTAYAKCLIAATPQEQLLRQESPKQISGLKPKDIARIEREMEVLEADFRRLENTHGRNMLNLVLAVGYLRRLLDNAPVVKYLSRTCGDLLTELEQIADTTNLNDAGRDAVSDGSPSE